MSSPAVPVEISWTDILVAGAGGGAVHGIADSFISGFLPATPVAGTGMTLKDIALILLGKYGAERVSGHWRTALKGMAVIGVYKVVYPQFIQPMITGLIKPVAAPPAVAPPAAPPAKVPKVKTPAAKAATKYATAKKTVTAAALMRIR